METITFANNLTAKINELVEKFKADLDYNLFETEIVKSVNENLTPLIQGVLIEVLADKKFMEALKVLAGQKCLSYEGHRLIDVNILNGQRILLPSPYFFNRSKKKGRKKQGRKTGNNIDCHLGLTSLGFISNHSGNLANEVCKTVIISPSYEMARTLLEDRGIRLDIKTMERICRDIGNIGLFTRGKFCTDGTENLEGQTLVVSLDGGRLRERRAKRGKKAQGQKRQGYTAEWREPKLFTIYVIDESGEQVKEIPPIYDATLLGPDAVVELLERYLGEYDLSQLKRIVFSADGAPWIWNRLDELAKKKLPGVKTYQVLDYTHAQQALGEIFGALAETGRGDILKQAKYHLWQGEIDGIKALIAENLKGQAKTKGLKKWKSYFDGNRHRMQYKTFKENGIPCGSGYVESAIRRVINMRLKSCGTFWLAETAELFLFLRCQLISGRWNIFFKNLLKRNTAQSKGNINSIIKTNYYEKLAA